MGLRTLAEWFRQLLDYLHPFWAGAWGAIQLALPLLLTILVVELIKPAQRLHWKTVLLNAFYTPFYLTVSLALLHPVSTRLGQWLPNNLLGMDFSGQPSLVSIIWLLAYLVAFDFLFYLFHRAQHRFAFLWRYHMVHHSDVNVSMFTSIRHHWMEESFRYFFIAAPMVILFGGTEQVPLWLIAGIGLAGLVIHWNMPWRLGFLHRWVVTPWYHRVHHSVEPRHFDTNFAIMLPFWDWLFRTRYLPAEGELPQTGLSDLARANGPGLLFPWPLPRFKKDDPPAASVAFGNSRD